MWLIKTWRDASDKTNKKLSECEWCYAQIIS